MGKFVIRKTSTGIKFDLKAGNGETIATSEVYTSEDACRKGIASVQKNAPAAAVEDQTVEGYPAAKHPKFEVYADKAGEFRFRLKAVNGQIIAVSEGYKAMASCMNGKTPPTPPSWSRRKERGVWISTLKSVSWRNPSLRTAHCGLSSSRTQPKPWRSFWARICRMMQSNRSFKA